MNAQIILQEYYSNLRFASSQEAFCYREAKQLVAFAPRKFFEELAEKLDTELSDIIEIFKNWKIVKFFSKIGWSFKKLYQILRDGWENFKDVVKVVKDFMYDNKVTRWTGENIEKLNIELNNNILTKRIVGAGAGVLLAYLWFKASYVGDASFDFDLDDVIKAFSGAFVLQDLIDSASQNFLLYLTGKRGMDFPWPGEASVHFIALTVVALTNAVGIYLKKRRSSIVNSVLKEFKSNNKERNMNKSAVKKIALEILAMPMMVIDPTRVQSREILKAMRSHFGIEASDRPLWRQYVTVQEGTSNKYHYFAVFQTGDGKFAAANAYGRIGYPTRSVVELGEYMTKEQALSVAKNKLKAKMAKGYKITPLFHPEKGVDTSY